MIRIAAVASAGGHWIQLMRLSPVFEGYDVLYITTAHGVMPIHKGPVHMVTDSNRWERLKMIRMFLGVARVMFAERPDVVITTGAAPGLAAIFFGRLIGATTIWVDSIANSEQMSGSGKLAKRFASLCLTQWEHLASHDGPQFWGAVL